MEIITLGNYQLHGTDFIRGGLFIQLQLLLSVEPECYSLLSAQEHAVFCAR